MISIGDNHSRNTSKQQADPDIVTLRGRIMKLLDTAPFVQYGYMEYADAPAYAAQVEEAARTLRSLTAAGKASTTVTLAREAIDRLHGVYEQIDDSSGTIDGVAAELEEAHQEACAASGTDPAGTAEWLATHMLGAWSHVPEIDLGDYWNLLGNTGRARFGELVAKVSRRSGSAWAVNHLETEIARLEGNVDALVAALAADPDPYGRTHHRIAEELDRAGRSDEALEWAGRGLRDTSPPPFEGDALADYVAARYEGEGRLADAVTVRRERFRASPSLAGYRSLREAGRKAGRWDTERTAALNLLREAEPARETQVLHGDSLLVDALIDDGDPDGAWQAAEGRAGDRQWLELADLVRDEHPAKALEVYRRAIETRARLTGNGNYREAAKLLLQARDCHRRLGTESDFTTYVSDLRTAQRRKRNLMKILDEHGL